MSCGGQRCDQHCIMDAARLTFAGGQQLLVLGARIQDAFQLQPAQLALRDDGWWQCVPQRVCGLRQPNCAAGRANVVSKALKLL